MEKIEVEASFNRYSTATAFYAGIPISLALLINFYSSPGTVAVKGKNSWT